MFHFIGILLKAGLPIAVTSFALVWWALRKDYLGGASTLSEYEQWKKTDDRARKAAKKEQKARRKAQRQATHSTALEAAPAATGELQQSAEIDVDGLTEELHPGKRKSDFLHSKWMEFGGGFYGVVAFYTYVLIELDEVKDFFIGLFHLFDQGLISLLVNFFVQSIMNFIAAITWPVYWLSRIHTEQWLWVIGAYGGYWLGTRAAFRFGTRSSSQ
jgi:hypothetical protein